MDAQTPDSQATDVAVPDSLESEQRDVVVSGNDQGNLSSDYPAVEIDSGKTPKATLQPAIIRAEANCLRWPIFANGTKGLKTLDGFELVGSRSDGGNSEEYFYRCTRNTEDVYPGDLSRRIHHALLAKLENQGFPFKDSVTFTWRELATLMNRSWKGQNRKKYEAAIRATHGLRIRSNLALKHKTSYCDVETKTEKTEVVPLSEREEGFPLYTGYVFQGDTLADGTVSDLNRVTFGPWLINNLNSYYYAKLDRELWLRLDDVGPLASRLYEYLLFSRSGDRNRFRIRYERLCMFLPATVMKGEAAAKRQFEDALDALRMNKVISRAAWGRTASNELLIEFYYGDRVRTTKTRSSVATINDDDVEVRELRNSRSEQAELVSAFYAAWTGNPHHKPWAKELSFASEIVELYKLDKALELIPHIVDLLRESNFEHCKTFNGTSAFWEDANDRHTKAAKAERIKKKHARDKQKEERRKQREQEVFEAARAEFLALPDDERLSIEEAFQAATPPSRYAMTRKFKNILLDAQVKFYIDQK